MIARLLRSIAVVGAAWMLSAGTASAQAPVVSAATSGNVVTISWSATAGAAGYRLDAGTAAGNYNLGSIPLGPVTSLAPVGLLNGVYFVRVVALPGNEASAEVRIQLPSPPAAPTGLAIARNGTGLVATWAAGSSGAVPDGYQIQFGYASGQTIIGFPTSTTAWGMGGGVPPATYYARVVALTGPAVSDPSNEVVVTMPAGGACDAVSSDFTATAPSGIISLSWTQTPGVATFIDAAINGVPQVSNVPIPGRINFGFVGTPSGGSVMPLGTYGFNARTVLSCGAQATRAVTLVNTGAPPAGPRAADPAPGQLLPVPNYLLTVVNRIASRYPGQLRNSCAEHGGNNRFIFEVVRELRTLDSRWGLNIKRGYQGLSQDVVTYNRSALPDEGATTGPTGARRNISLYDIIAGHCGPNPGPWVSEVTGATIDGGSRAVWTLTPYLDAGYKP